MAYKKSPTAKNKKKTGELQAAMEELGVIEKDVGKVRANLKRFLEQSERLLSGAEFKVPTKRRPRKKRQRS